MRQNDAGTAAFTLLELLVALIIAGISLAITYPIISSRLDFSGNAGPVAKTDYAVKYFLKNRYGKFRKRDIYIKFDFGKQTMSVYYRAKYKMKKLKGFKFGFIKYKNGGAVLRKIVSAGNTINSGVFYIAISSFRVSPPVTLYFNSGGKKKKLFIDTYYD